MNNTSDLEVYQSGAIAEALALAQAEIEQKRRKVEQKQQETAAKNTQLQAELEEAFWRQMGKLGQELTPFLVDEALNTVSRRLAFVFLLPDGVEVEAAINGAHVVTLSGPDLHGTQGMAVRDNMSEADLREFGLCLRIWRRATVRLTEQMVKELQYDAWRADMDAYQARAEAALANLQARIDQQHDFYTFQLTYRPDTGEAQCSCGQDWHSITVLDDEPDEDGWWSAVYHNGQILACRIYHPVSLDEPERHIPSKSRLARIIERPGGAKVWVAPRMEPEALAEIEAEMDRIVEALGPVPVHPGGDEAAE